MYVTHRYDLPESSKELLHSLTPKFGYNGFGELVFYRTYSRIKKDGKQENWADCIIRVVNGVFSIRKDFYVKNRIPWDEQFWDDYATGLALSAFNMEWLPPGRGLWAMGSDFVYERGSMALYNCAYTLMRMGEELVDDVGWLMDSLMNGVGVGFGPIRDKLRLYNPKGKFDFIIPDTREGWVECTQAIVRAYTVPDQKLPVPIYDQVRPAGLPIKGFGGISSGPEPLKKLHDELIGEFEDYKNDPVYLKTNIANRVGCAVVAGNVRRSAEIGCAPITDPVFLDLKDLEKYPERAGYYWMSNNSVLLETDEDFEQLGEVAKRVVKNGEPGVINKRNLQHGRIGKSNEGLRKDVAVGLNPCQPPWAKILTPNGVRELGDVGVGDKIWSETGWTKIVKKWSTGINKVFKYTTTAGIFYGTERHSVLEGSVKIEAQFASAIDQLVGPPVSISKLDPQHVADGLYIGDGSYHNNVTMLNIGANDQDYFQSEISEFIGATYSRDYQFRFKTTLNELPVPRNRFVPEKYLKGTSTEVRGFLRGLFSANGSVVGGRVQLKAASFDVIEATQTMLSSLGIRSYWTLNKPKMVKFKNGDYLCEESYDLAIGVDRRLFRDLIGFVQGYKADKLDQVIKGKAQATHSKETFDIVSVDLVSEEETFDITVDNFTHTYWTQGLNVSNCGEIPLEHRETCNLSETLPTMCENVDRWYKACEYASFYSSTVSLLPTHQPSTNKVVARNRRIGVGIIDFSGWKKDNGVHKVTPWLRNGYDVVRETNRWANGEAGVPEAIRVTTMKPGGTVPKLPGKTSGFGNPTFHETLRRIRVQQGTSYHKVLADANIPYEKDYYSANTDVFEYPILQGPAKPAEEVTLWEQGTNLVLLQREWADNAVSNTLYFRPMWRLIGDVSEDVHGFVESYLGLPKMLEIVRGKIREYVLPEQFKFAFSFDGMKIMNVKLYEYDPKHEENDVEPVLSSIIPMTKSISVLPHTPKGVYKQMPEEGISKEEYHERLKSIRKIDWSKFSGSDGMDEKYCTGDTCGVP